MVASKTATLKTSTRSACTAPRCVGLRRSRCGRGAGSPGAGADPNIYNRRDRGTHPLACAMQNTRPWSEVELISALKEAGAVVP